MDETQIKHSLDIFWNGRIVGRYDLLDDGSELFSYDGSYLESADAAPISYSLPLRADPYGKRQLRPFFAGLLPEESQRQRIAVYLGLAESDDFSMLEAIGGEWRRNYRGDESEEQLASPENYSHWVLLPSDERCKRLNFGAWEG